MKKFLSSLAAATLALLPTLLAADIALVTTAPDKLLQQAVANSRDWFRSNPQIALEYLQTIEIGDDDSLQQQVRHIDERLPPEQRITLVSIDRQPPDDTAIAKFNKQRQQDLKSVDSDDDRRGPISLDGFDISDARLVGQREQRLVYEVPNAVHVMIGANNAGMAEHLRMKVEVDPDHIKGPYLTRLAVESIEPFKPGLLGKVEHFRMQMDLTLHDSGRLVMDRMDVDVRASAMFRNIETRRRVRFSDYQAHPAAPAD